MNPKEIRIEEYDYALPDERIALFYLVKNSTEDCYPVVRFSDDKGTTWTAPKNCIKPFKGYYVMNNVSLYQVDFNYNGFAENSNGWWYCKGGKVQFGTNSVISGTVNDQYGWWHVIDGKVTFDNTVASNGNGWWLIENGKVNFEAETVAKNSNGWWKISEGKVDFNYNGFAENNNGWWYCKGGKVQFGTNSVLSGTVNGQYGWWHVVNGKVTFDNTVASNGNGWWVIQNGKVNFAFNGTYKTENITYMISGGKVISTV